MMLKIPPLAHFSRLLGRYKCFAERTFVPELINIVNYEVFQKSFLNPSKVACSPLTMQRLISKS